MRPLADEVPFDIPDSWEWVRLGSAFAIEMGQSPAGNTVSGNCSGTEFHQGKVFFGEKYIKASDQYTSSPTKFAPKNSVLLCVRAPVGKVNITDRGLCIGRGLCAIIPLAGMPLLFAYYLLAAYENIFVKQATGTTFVAITAETVKKQLIPMPPLAEQQRIADLIERLIPYVDEYGKAESAVDQLNCHFPEALKKSILQEAVQGKLVPQDPSDEPAEALLERIRAEKQRLIKEGKIKKDKHESVIFRRDNSHYEKRGSEEVCIDEEIPFEIPENWAWCRASSLGTMIRGRGIKRTETVAQGCPCIRYGEIYTTYETSFDSAVSFVPETLDKDCLHFSYGDVVFTLTGENKVDIAKTVAFLGEGQIAAGGDLAFWTHHGMNPLYLVYYMASPYCIELKRRTATGDIIVHISTSKVGDFLVPIPPIKEQNRIVSAIEQLFAVASTL